MPRTKSPQKTINKILYIASKLFSQKGFEQVKMQDIIDKLTTLGFTKGAIYHHFKNKEDILQAILAQYEEQIESIWRIQRSQINARDKLKNIMLAHIAHIFAHKSLIRSSLKILNSPYALANRMQITHNNLSPIIESIIEQGNIDGSLSVAYPKPASQMLAWAVYVWLDNAFYPLSQSEYTHKIRHLRIMFEGVGLSVIDEEVSSEFLRLWREIIAD